MNPHTLGIIIGGILPAIFFGFSNVLIKVATEKGISIPLYVLITGIAVVIVGVGLHFIYPDRGSTTSAGLVTFLAGLIWAVSMVCILIALQKYSASISTLVPLYNLNTLIAVSVGLLVFAEWKTVAVPQLLFGSVLIVVGGTLVARA